MFFRTLFILIGLVIVWFLVKRWAKNALQEYIEQHAHNHNETIIEGGAMVRCQYCGVYVSKADAVEVNEHYFCCEEHQRLSQK